MVPASHYVGHVAATHKQHISEHARVFTTSRRCVDVTPVSFLQSSSPDLRHGEPAPKLAPTWNMAPTKDAPVVRLSTVSATRRVEMGPGPLFTKDLKKAPKSQRQIGDHRQIGNVQGGVRQAALPRARPRLLRMARRSRGQDAVRCRAHRWRSGRFRRHLGKVIPRGGGPANLRHHHDRREPPACRDTGPHAGDHRTG